MFVLGIVIIHITGGTMRSVVCLALITLCLPARAEEAPAPAPAASGEPYLELELVGPLSEARVRPLLEAHLADCIAQGVSGTFKYIRRRNGRSKHTVVFNSLDGVSMPSVPIDLYNLPVTCIDGRELTLPDAPEKKRIRVQASFGSR